jgi:hypothetical protein
MDFRDYIEKTTPRAANDGTFYILYIYHYISRELYRTRPVDSFLAYSLRHAFCLRCTSPITAHLLLATTYVLDSGGLLMNVLFYKDPTFVDSNIVQDLFYLFILFPPAPLAFSALRLFFVIHLHPKVL